MILLLLFNPSQNHGQGQVRIGGQISMIDNINRILDRVALYLA